MPSGLAGRHAGRHATRLAVACRRARRAPVLALSQGDAELAAYIGQGCISQRLGMGPEIASDVSSWCAQLQPEAEEAAVRLRWRPAGVLVGETWLAGWRPILTP